MTSTFSPVNYHQIRNEYYQKLDIRGEVTVVVTDTMTQSILLITRKTAGISDRDSRSIRGVFHCSD